jgi:Pentapeptide repeats (9 copies)
MSLFAKEFASLDEIADAQTHNFVELIRISGIDPKRHLRFADWSAIDFSGCDLRGYDFTGARLQGCRFDGALILGARFDYAELNKSDLSAAADWTSYKESNLRASRSGEGHAADIEKLFGCQIGSEIRPDLAAIAQYDVEAGMSQLEDIAELSLNSRTPDQPDTREADAS